ncbi:MAG: adenine phosphoribosyltransferase [Candidatus Zixiibacteriota bacterium]|nr:MAG: adenine phosphoribosyltransferase [candidate division Zixibacteria bacterium]
MDKLKTYVRSVPDFPKKGINFYDITTLLDNPTGFEEALSEMERYIRGKKADRIVGIEARGFIFGAALADRLKLPFVPARKPGKLPYRTVSASYDLEYGTDSIEIHTDGVKRGDKVVVVDDLIATGGTLAAVCKLVEKLGGEVVGISAVIGLPFLPYDHKLAGYDTQILITYDSE